MSVRACERSVHINHRTLKATTGAHPWPSESLWTCEQPVATSPSNRQNNTKHYLSFRKNYRETLRNRPRLKPRSTHTDDREGRRQRLRPTPATAVAVRQYFSEVPLTLPDFLTQKHEFTRQNERGIVGTIPWLHTQHNIIDTKSRIYGSTRDPIITPSTRKDEFSGKVSPPT